MSKKTTFEVFAMNTTIESYPDGLGRVDANSREEAIEKGTKLARKLGRLTPDGVSVYPALGQGEIAAASSQP